MIQYVKLAAMITLCIFIPPLGWFFMYKFSTFDRKTNFILALACLFFFIYANISAGNVENIFGSRAGFEQSMTPEQFREKFNTASKRLAPNLNLTMDETFSDKNFTHEFSPTLKLEGTVDGGKVTELKIFAEPKNQDESFQVINVLGLIIATLNPELDAEDRGKVMRDLRMLREVSTGKIFYCMTTRGAIKYSVHADGGNVIFTAAFM